MLGVLAGAASLALASLGANAANAVNAVTVIVVAVLLAYGPRRLDPLRRTRWLLLGALGAAFASSVMSAAYQIVNGHPAAHPWAADAVSLLYVPFTVAGLLLVPPASQRTGYRARAISDGVLAMSCLWYLVAGMAGPHFGHSGARHTLDLVDAATDVSVVATALAVLSRCSASVVLTVSGIAGGVTAVAANDTWLLLSGRSPYSLGSSVLFQAGLLLFVLAAALPPPRKAATIQRVARIRWALGAAPFFPLLVCIGVTVAMIVHGHGIPQRQAIPVLFVAIAVLARQYATSRDKQRLVEACASARRRSSRRFVATRSPGSAIGSP